MRLTFLVDAYSYKQIKAQILGAASTRRRAPLKRVYSCAPVPSPAVVRERVASKTAGVRLAPVSPSRADDHSVLESQVRVLLRFRGLMTWQRQLRLKLLRADGLGLGISLGLLLRGPGVHGDVQALLVGLLGRRHGTCAESGRHVSSIAASLRSLAIYYHCTQIETMHSSAGVVVVGSQLDTEALEN